MSPAANGRTQRCSEPHARTRLNHARRFLDVAQLAAGEDDALDYSSAAAALAVLAGIAASDAACCKALGRRARGHGRALPPAGNTRSTASGFVSRARGSDVPRLPARDGDHLEC
jgi:hypothetical protein